MLLWSAWGTILLLTTLEAAEDDDVQAGNDREDIRTILLSVSLHSGSIYTIHCFWWHALICTSWICVCLCMYRLQHSYKWPGLHCWWLMECRFLWLWHCQAVAYQHHQPIRYQFPLYTGKINQTLWKDYLRIAQIWLFISITSKKHSFYGTSQLW